MDNFIYEYFVSPIWSKTGYNTINTLAYAAIAIIAVYFLRNILRGRGFIDPGHIPKWLMGSAGPQTPLRVFLSYINCSIKLERPIAIDGVFIRSVLCFVLFGSTIRVVTDSIDTGVFRPVTPIHAFVLESHIWDYGYLTVTPGIYVVTAALLGVSLLVLYKLKKVELLGYVGLALWIPHLLLLLPFMGYAIYALPVIALAALPAYLAYRYFKDPVLSAIVAGQALDGAATFFVIDIFSGLSGKQYFEQHVFSSGIGSMFGGYFAFYLIKVAIAFMAAWVLRDEKMDTDDRNFVALVLMIMGFAPGIRDILRMMVGA